MKKILLFVFLWVFGLSSFAQTIRYVGPAAVGKGDGQSSENAADFLNDQFWLDIQQELKKKKVTVRFLAGDYARSYTQKPLTLLNMGNERHVLRLIGDSAKTVFRAPGGGKGKKSQLVMIKNSSNIVVRNFAFTGDGVLNYVLNITSGEGGKTNNILIEGCTWEDMKGVVYGATGATLGGTQKVVFKNCSFKRIGMNAGSHMIYNAYSSRHISVINCYFENCTGDYVRFRDKCDYGMVKGCTFVHNNEIPSVKFIAMPLYNDGKPSIGNESFATNYAFAHNSFSSSIENVYSVFFSNRGYTAPGYNFILSPEEGAVLTNGTTPEKKALLEQNFGIYPEKVRVYGNTYHQVGRQIYLSSNVGYGAVSKGWQGKGEITPAINSSAKAFKWESKVKSGF
ncbi:MAG: right-handed parallel beta-helix repeat-containing protein [Adhaeribacter sp.]